MLWRLLRPCVPETLVLQPNDVVYDSGVAPLRLSLGHQRFEYLKTLFKARIRITLDRPQLRTIALRSIEAGNRLTIDAGIKRIDIADAATEIEREWLYRELTKRYP